MGSQTTNYLRDETSLYGYVVLESTSGGSVSYTLAGTDLLSQARNGTTSYYLQDGQHSTRAITNNVGNVTDTYSYTAFGDRLSHSSSTVNPYQYTGQQLDVQTGLYDLRARFYDPIIGRFLSQDPYPYALGDPSQLNRYVYTADNPVNAIDPLGLQALEEYSMLQQKNQEQADAEYSATEGDSLLSESESCNSFTADTEVATKEGEKAISKIQVGDFVLAWNWETGEIGFYRVSDTIHHTDKRIVKLTVDDETLTTTLEHPFYVEGKGWVFAKDLKAGDRIRRADGTSGEVKSVQIEQATREMYNLTVDQAHTFFVGEGQWLVHNACGVRHKGFIKQLAEMRDSSLNSTIRSITKNIDEHLQWIADNPTSRDIPHWQGEIKTFQEELELALREVAQREALK